MQISGLENRNDGRRENVQNPVEKIRLPALPFKKESKRRMCIAPF